MTKTTQPITVIDSSRRTLQRGAVSLFVVVFAILLITIVTVSFLRLMIHDQEQATTQDVSQSALDSAYAGVEDAKRALLRYQAICNSDKSRCDTLTLAALSDPVMSSASWRNCNQSLDQIVSSTGGEVQVEQTDDGQTSEQSLQQYYTCVKVQLETADFLGSVGAGSSKIIPLVGADAFDTVEVNWYTTDDLAVGAGATSFDVNLLSASSALPLQSTWPASRPSVMRTQLMQFGSNGFTLDSFNATDTSNSRSNANTLFLYPTGTTGTPVTGTPTSRDFINRDIRKTPTGSPLAVRCSGRLSGGGYACRQRLVLPTPINGGDRTAFLRLTPYYNATHFSVALVDSSSAQVVNFSGVQPAIDSTGRANNFFRRVETRVELIDNTFPYPDEAVDITGDLCKDFSVTDTAYIAGATCNP